MKKIKKILSLSMIVCSIVGIEANAETVNLKKSNPINIEINENDFKNNSISVMSVDGKLVERVAKIDYKGKLDSDGNKFPYSLTVKIPYTTYEDSFGKTIYSIDDDEITSYLAGDLTVREYEQTYVRSKIASKGQTANIKGSGQITVTSSLMGKDVYSVHDVDFSVTLKPTTGR